MATKKKASKKKSAKRGSKKKTPATDTATDDEKVDAEWNITDDPAIPVRTEGLALQQADPTFQRYEIAKRIAHTLAMSSLVPEDYQRRPADCFVAINMGAEIGMEPFQAIQSIAVIDGKPCLYGDGLIGVVRASPKCEWIEETINQEGTSATCTTQRKGDRSPVSATYTIADADQAGLTSKYNWKKYPKRMLQMRARAFCLRDAYPDVLKGLGVVEEMLDHEDTPAPIRSYDLPERETREAPDSSIQPEPPPQQDDDPITLAQVERMIERADDMESLLRASEAAQLLTNPNEKSTARIVYRRKREALRRRLAGSTEGQN